MGDAKIVYGSSTSITIGPGALANQSAWQSASVDNTSNKFKDALITLKTNVNGTIAAGLAIHVLMAGCEDLTNFDYPATGSDATITIAANANLKYVGKIELPAGANGGSTAYRGVFSLARAYGGVLPPKWSIAIINDSGLALVTATTTLSYTGIYDTVA